MIEHLLGSILLFVVGTIAAFINVNAGGGSSLTLPTLIFLGLDTATANGTNRIAILTQTFASVHAFKKESYSQFKLSWKLSLLTLPGAVIGAFAAVEISDEIFKKVLAVIMIGIIVMMLLPNSKKILVDNSENKKLTPLTFIAFILIGFYGGIVQVGIGFLLMSVLQKMMKFNLIYVNMHKSFIVCVLTVPALLIFILLGKVDWYWGISLALGNTFGGWWATKISIRKGDKFIKAVLAISILIIAVKLFGFF